LVIVFILTYGNHVCQFEGISFCSDFEKAVDVSGFIW
jgi:hypothetical protein